MIRICTTLCQNGHSVLLIGRKLRASEQLIEKSYQQKRLFCFFEKGKLFYVEYNIRLFFYLFFQRFDVVCGIDLDTSLPTIAVANLKNKKHFYDAHEWFPYVPEVICRPNVQKFWLWVEKITFKNTDKVYTVSHSIATEFEKIHQKKVALVRNMPVLDFQTRPIPIELLNQLPSDRFVLYQGALNQGRGLELLIESIQGTSIHIVIAGDGDLIHDLKELTCKFGVDKQVTFLGFVSPSYLRNLTKRAFIGYNVSENLGLSYYYSLNNKFFDYVEAELPSLINSFPEYKQLLSEYQVGILCENTVESIRGNLQLIYNQDEYYNQLKAQCVAAKKVWNWEIESQKLIELYCYD